MQGTVQDTYKREFGDGTHAGRTKNSKKLQKGEGGSREADRGSIFVILYLGVRRNHIIRLLEHFLGKAKQDRYCT